MKFLYGILILAGVLAINDALEAQARIANEQLHLEELRLEAENRAVNSPKCFEKYLADMTTALGVYQTGLGACDDALNAQIASINETMEATHKEISANVQKVCDSMTACSVLSPAITGVQCDKDQGSINSKLLSEISVSAATAATEYDKNIANAASIEKVCTEQCSATYTTESNRLDTEFEKCRADDAQGVPPATEATPPPPTEAPETEAPVTEAPPPPTEAPAPEGRRLHSANKYRRF